ncbi:DegT/DnrJ/EryC1/StrS family aminotransferase [Castellaniella ginsengisoli]
MQQSDIIVPFLDLQTINARYRDELLASCVRVIDSGRYVAGEELKAFEREFSTYCGTEHCVGVGNGLDALALTLHAWKSLGLLKEGDEVIVPANTYIATILAVLRVGLKPVLVEPDPLTYNLDPTAAAQAITHRTRVILPVHLYGRLADMPRICNLAASHDLLVLEDAAQAHGACLDGCRAGAWGDAAAFSFYPGKNLGALGDGGAVVMKNAKMAHVVRALGNYGSHEKYVHEMEGVNSRLDEMQAAMLSVKLQYLDRDTAARRRIAAAYLTGIRHPLIQLPDMAGFHPSDCPWHVWHLFVVCSDRRDALRQWLERQGVQSLIHYPTPPHRQQALRKQFDVRLPITDRIHRMVLSLPLWSGMTDEQIEHVIFACNAFDL